LPLRPSASLRLASSTACRSCLARVGCTRACVRVGGCGCCACVRCAHAADQRVGPAQTASARARYTHTPAA
jgi:hypothetical protein